MKMPPGSTPTTAAATSPARYSNAYTTGTLGTILETVLYTYGDSNWKDKLTAYNGKTITYDEIGNPLNDGERTYTWGAGRQLRHISMPLSGTGHGFRTTEGTHADSGTVLRIVESGSTLTVKVLRGNRDLTSECPASAFKWTRVSGNTSADAAWNNAHAGTKQVSFTESEASGAKYNCTYTETQGSFGTVNVNDTLMATHTQGTTDAKHTFSIDNGALKVEIPSNNGGGTEYALANNVLTVNNGFTGSITATYEFTISTMRDIDFSYDYNGLRTQKKVVENGITTICDYTLHGKLITHMTAGNDNLHFFYGAQSRPAKVVYNGIIYTYLYNLQGDIIGILDKTGTLVVEYKYNAWGKVLCITGMLADTLGKQNPFCYRSYVYDRETGLYYLRSRYYNPNNGRFVNADNIMGKKGILFAHNCFAYCKNDPICFNDTSGHSWALALLLIGLAFTLSGCSSTSNANIREYNCYAYAVGKTVWMSPGGTARKQRYMSENQPYKIKKEYFDVQDTALAVLEDLGGKTNAQIVRGVDSAVPDGWHLIAVRTGSIADSDGYVTVSPYRIDGDFHFMRLDDGVWSHKPGSTAIQYLPTGVTPDSDEAWSSIYTSDVIYMIVRDDWE